ncbi:MAG: transglycosylase SLT domain-containing protein [Firmicutes bacterium]|nr:transglycosylase SLT domain-containing protein [Bacillota bacterium]
MERAKTVLIILLFIVLLVTAVAQSLTMVELAIMAKEVTRMQNEGELLRFQLEESRKFFKDAERLTGYIRRYRPRASEHELNETALYIVFFAQKHQVDPIVVAAMIATESGFKRNAFGSAGERGLLQVLPETFIHWGKGNLDNWQDTLEAGIRYFAYLEQKYQGNIRLAIAAYNAGPGAVKAEVPVNSITQRHVHRVMMAYRGVGRTLGRWN